MSKQTKISRGRFPMNSLNDKALNFNNRIKFNFNGGDLTSDSGLLLLREFDEKLGFSSLIKNSFKTTDTAKHRFHCDADNLIQKVYMSIASYFADSASDELRLDPLFNHIFAKKLASQPTLSRFFSRMDKNTIKQLDEINMNMRKRIYSVEKPKHILLDVDSTNFKTFGKQEESSFNFHYKSNGYHPLLAFDGLTGDLLKAELRPGSIYTSNGIEQFIRPLIKEFSELEPDTHLSLRGDSGFAKPKLYELLEENSVSYAIRLKANASLYSLAAGAVQELTDICTSNILDYKVVYDEFYYQANSWDVPRRVVVKVEKPSNQMVFMHSFIVTNMELSPMQVLMFYCNRGKMENYIKEFKNGFRFDRMSSNSFLTNQNKLQMYVITYNLFNWFRRLVLSKEFRKLQIDTIRIKMFKVAAKVVRGGGYIKFKLCSYFQYKKEFMQTLDNIYALNPKLE